MSDVTQFTTEPPNAKRTLVVARDPDSGKSKSITLYNVAPEDFIKWLRETAEKNSTQPEPASAA